MRNYDLSPLFRSTIGFDGLSRMLDAAAQGDNGSNAYPPYNIENDDGTRYHPPVALAAFAEGYISVDRAAATLDQCGKGAFIIRSRRQELGQGA